MTQRTSARTPLVRAAATSLILAAGSWTATARADQSTAAFIPAPGEKSDPARSNLAATDAESAGSPQALPLPYTPWQGQPPRPPTVGADAARPLPLVRPRELPRRPWDVSAALAAFLPSCSAGSIGDRGCSTISAGAGLEAALVYRITPFFGVGIEGALSGFAGTGRGAFSGAGGGARYAGVVGRVYFADSGAWDPYASLALGVGKLHLESSDRLEREATSGLGARVSGGIDYSFGSHLRVGPSASFSHWLTYGEERCNNGFCRSEPVAYGRLLGFATLGVRVSGSFGAPL